MNKELKKYVPIAQIIAETFGKDCEVVIHDLSVPQASIAYVVNGHVTEKRTERNFDHLIKNVLLARDFANDCKCNYLLDLVDGRQIKASTAFIRDAKSKIIGALCINYDMGRFQQMDAALREFLHIDSDVLGNDTEPFEHVVDIVDDLIDKIINKTDIEHLKRREKVELIQFMDSKGIFLIKGMIEKVADKLNISKVTVYSYLDEIKKNNPKPRRNAEKAAAEKQDA